MLNLAQAHLAELLEFFKPSLWNHLVDLQEAAKFKLSFCLNFQT